MAPTWTSHGDLDAVEPTNGLAAIVVDMRNASAHSLHIHDGNDEYVDEVGLEFSGFVVIVLWVTGLKYVCHGSCSVGLIHESAEGEFIISV